MTVLSKRLHPRYDFRTRETWCLPGDYEWLGYGRVRNKKTGDIIDTNRSIKRGVLKTTNTPTHEISDIQLQKYKQFNLDNAEIKWMYAY